MQEYGGLQLPIHVSAITRVPFVAANSGLAGTNFDVTQGVANLIHTCAAKELADKWVPQIVTGESFGTMCLSEPHAGSSLTDVR